MIRESHLKKSLAPPIRLTRRVTLAYFGCAVIPLALLWLISTGTTGIVVVQGTAWFGLICIVWSLVGMSLVMWTGKKSDDAMAALARILTSIGEGSFENAAGTLKALRLGSMAWAESVIAAAAGRTERLRSAIENVLNATGNLTKSVEEASHATGRIFTCSDEIAGRTREQKQAVEQGIAAVNELASAISQIANSAHEQARLVYDSQQIVRDMAHAVQEVASTAQSLSVSTQQTSQSAEAGGEAIKKTLLGMERIKETVLSGAGSIRELGERSRKIGEIVRVIGDIADQTNLLALNAAIEAARAGEHGKGFAVVAEEVRRLAERSARATKEISALVSSIEEGVSHSVKGMEAVTKEVESGSSMAIDAGTALERILQTLEDTTSQYQNISAATQQLAANSSEIVRAIDNIASITEQNTAATEEMAAGSREVNGVMELVGRTSHDNLIAVEAMTASTEEMKQAAKAVTKASRSLSEVVEELGRRVEV